MILGFDPRYQFVHEDDVVHALEHAVNREVRGVYNVAGDGVLALSEVAGLLGKPYAPLIPPWGTGLAAAGLRRVGIRIPPEAMNQLRFGRGVDNRRYKAAGFHYQHTSRETVLKLGEHLRLSPVVRGAREPYRYEREVEEFLRWSPHVRNARDAAGHVVRRLDPAERERRQVEIEAEALAARREASEAMERAVRLEEIIEKLQAQPEKPPPRTPRRAAAPAPAPPRRTAPVEHYDDLASEEVIALLGSLDAGDLAVLRDHERDHARRAGVLAAIDSVLARTGAPD